MTHLTELLEFRPDEGIIRLHEQRVVVLSAAAMGLLRKELIDTLGVETARRIFLRFGFADGYHDAVSLRDRSKWKTPLDGVAAGVELHRLEGIVRAKITRLEHEPACGRFHEEVEWHDSYVAEQHLHHHGISPRPVCWSLEGYASGYVSACVGQEIYFKETACLAQGAASCSVVGKNAARWGDELEAFRSDFHGADLGRAIERVRDSVHRRLQEVDRRERLLAKRERELDVLRDRVTRHAAARQVIAGTRAMHDVLELAARVAPLDTAVLVCGESGTGKEYVVRMIHDQSGRRDGPFVSVNCAALTETLLESELFGHTRGAFTGAVREKIGLFEVATGGTLFLDEIGEIAPAVQAKLLRALQEHEIRRVGGERTITVNARIVAATNRDLRGAVAAGAFRDDLYFRLGAFVITLPPLRDRREDIPALVRAFVRRAASRVKRDVTAVSPDAMTALTRYHWPGNIRELEHAIERAVIVARGSSIRLRELPPEVWRDEPRDAGGEMLNLRANEREMIERALRRFRGSRRDAADALKISTVTLWRRIKRYGIDV